MHKLILSVLYSNIEQIYNYIISKNTYRGYKLDSINYYTEGRIKQKKRPRARRSVNVYK